MRRAEIDAGDLPVRVRGGQRQRSEAATATQLEIGKRAFRGDGQTRHAAEQAGDVQVQRRLVMVVAGQVGDIGHITIAPIGAGRTHRRP